MKEEVIETKWARFWMANDGILHVVNTQGAETGIEVARQAVQIAKMYGEKKIPLYVDISKIKSISQEARKYYAGEEAGQRISVCAMRVESPTSKIIGNFFLGLSKPVYPVKLFTSEEMALKWLRDNMEREEGGS